MIFVLPISIQAEEMRAKYNLKTPDCLQIATASECKADYFLINDLHLKIITEIKVIKIGKLM